MVESPVSDYEANVFCILGAIIREDAVIFPKRSMTLRAKDHLFIVTSLKDEKAAHALFTLGPSEFTSTRPGVTEE